MSKRRRQSQSQLCATNFHVRTVPPIWSVVHEEVQVGKRQVTDTKRVSDEVRHEELRTDTDGELDEQAVEKTREKTRRTA